MFPIVQAWPLCLHMAQVLRLKYVKNACFSNNSQCCLEIHLNGHLQYGQVLSTLLGFDICSLNGFRQHLALLLLPHFYSSLWIVGFLLYTVFCPGNQNVFPTVGGGARILALV